MSDAQYVFPHEDADSLNKYYGDPSGRNGLVSPSWYKDNIVKWKPPYQLYFSEGRVPLKTLLVHKLCVPTFDVAFTKVLNHFAPFGIEEFKLNICGGTFNYRPMRGGTRLSMHSYGIAIDIDPEHNPYPHPWTQEGLNVEFVNIMQDAGFWWRGYHGDVDPMHFQCAYRGVKPGETALVVTHTFEPPPSPGVDPVMPIIVHPADNSVPGTIFNFFVNNGLTKEQACGIVANVQAESGFKIENVGDGGLARGLFQMHPDRRATVFDGCGCDMKNGDVEEQCRGALWELQNVELVAYGKLKESETAFNAGYNVCRYYERPASHYEWVKRGRIAMKWFVHFTAV